MPYARRPRPKRSAPRKKKVVKYNGNKIKLSKGEGLSKQEFTQIKKMLPRIEVKQAYVNQYQSHFANYLANGNNLCNFAILGRTIISGSLGTTTGCDFMQQGITDGSRIGNRISVKKLSLDVHINLDGQFTDSSVRPGPYIFRWWIYRCKGTLNGASEGGLTADNTDWSQWFDLGNDVYQAPTCTQTDLYNKVNTNLYTVHRQGQFLLQTDKQKTQTDSTFSTNLTQPMMQSDSKLYKHIHLDLTKYCAKQLKYQDDIPGVNNCTNDAMFFCCNFLRFDGELYTENVNAQITLLPRLIYTDC